MKKYVLLILPSLFALSNVNAQKSSIILRGGVNLANVTISENGRIDDAKTLTSFQAGFIGDIGLGQFVSLQPGLLVTGKGSKTQSGETTDANYFKATSNPIYLEVPLNLVFKFGAKDGPSFFAGAGPYLAIGIAGYHYTADIAWLDALHNASMILSGMGPVVEITTVGGKWFSSVYALFSGVVFITNVGVILAPLAHRLFHRLHLEDK